MRVEPIIQNNFYRPHPESKRRQRAADLVEQLRPVQPAPRSFRFVDFFA